MNRKQMMAIFAALTIGCAAFAQGGAPAVSMKLPAFTRVQLRNGMTVLLLEKRQLPLVSFSFIVKAGSTSDPQGKEGLAAVTAGLLRKGTRTRSSDQISQELDFIGGTFSADATLDYTAGEAEFMSKDVSKGVDYVADMLTSATFPQQEFTKIIRQNTDAAKAAKDEPGQVIGLYYRAYLYGGQPYGRPVEGTEVSLAKLTTDDVKAFYTSHYAPQNTILVVAGDFDTASMRSLLEKTFESWPGGGSAQPTQARAKAANGKTKGKPLVADAVAAPQADSKLLLVNKPDATQTYFMLGNLGIDRRNPDRPYIEVVNTLFGGRFTSFINTALRIKSGLTYGASSRFEQRLNPGPFLISTFTKNATTEKAMDMTLDVLHQFHENGITQEQLDSAKAYIRGQFPPTLETTNQLARYLAQLEFYGLPATDLEDFFNKLNAMDLATAKRMIEKYYPEKQLVWVVIGKSDEIGPVVKKYAPKMETRSITDAGF